jgi:hypothetical protein
VLISQHRSNLIEWREEFCRERTAGRLSVRVVQIVYWRQPIIGEASCIAQSSRHSKEMLSLRLGGVAMIAQMDL